jgi:hypothetical protein
MPLSASPLLCDPSSAATPPGLDDADADVLLGDLLPQRLGEPDHG